MQWGSEGLRQSSELQAEDEGIRAGPPDWISSVCRRATTNAVSSEKPQHQLPRVHTAASESQGPKVMTFDCLRVGETRFKVLSVCSWVAPPALLPSCWT